MNIRLLLTSVVESAPVRMRTIVPGIFFALLFGVAPLHAQLNFNSGTFEIGMGAQAIALTPTGGSGNYAFSYAPPPAVPVPGMQVLNRPNVPSTFAATAKAGLIGLPVSPGTYPTMVRLTDTTTAAFVDRAITIVVRDLEIGGIFPTNYGVGESITSQLRGSGGTPGYTFELAGGTLPPGINLNSSGQISGTFTTAGTFNFSVKLTDSAGHTFTKAYSSFVAVCGLSQLSSRELPIGFVNQHYAQILGSCGLFSLVNGSLPAGLALSQSGAIEGTPTSSAYELGFTVNISAGSFSITRRFAITVLPLVATPLRITTNLIRDVSLGFNGNVNEIAAFGGLPPYSFSLEPGSTLPPDSFLAMYPEPSTDPGFPFLWTTARTAGDFNFIVKVTDSAGNFSTRAFNWHVSPIGVFYPSLPASGGPTPVLGTFYSQPTIILGGTPPYTVAPVDMATGLSIDNVGTVSGTPLEGNRNSLPNFDFTIRDSSSPQKLYFNDGFIFIDTPSPIELSTPGGVVTVLKGTQSAISLSASGSPFVPPDTYSATILSGTLPPGMLLLTPQDFNAGVTTVVGGLGSATVAQIAGVPTVTGSYSILLRIDDGAGNFGQRLFTILVSDLDFVNSAIATGTAGVPYNQTFDVRGGVRPYQFSLTNGTLPSGLTMDPSTGTISGTPDTVNAVTVGIRVTDALGDSIVRSYALTIYSLEITNPNILPTAFFGEPYSYAFTVNPPGSYTWSWSFASLLGTLPGNLSMDPNTGVLSGIVGTSGLSSFTVTASNSSTVVSKTFALPITTRSLSKVLSVAIPSSSLGSFVVGSAVTTTLGVSGGSPPYTIALVSPPSSLPPGLSLVRTQTVLGSSGFGSYSIAGIPTATGTYTFRLSYTDSAGLSTQRTVSMTILSSLSLATAALKTGVINVPYSTQLYGVGGSGSYSFSLGAGILPPGLSLSSSGVLSGIPTSTGAFAFTVTLSDGSSVRQQTVSVSFTNSGGRFINFTGGNFTATLGKGVSLTLTPVGSGTPATVGPFTWTISGSPPPGIRFLTGTSLPAGQSANNAILTGAPTAVGTYSFSIRVDDSTGNSGTRDFTYVVTPLRVGPANIPLTLGTTFLLTIPPPLQIGVPYSFALVPINNTTPVTFSTVAGSLPTLPPGITMDSSGLISGTPTEGGLFSQNAVMTDQAGNTTTLAIPLYVYPAGQTIGVLGQTTVALSNATRTIPYSLNLNDFLYPGFGTGPSAWSQVSGNLPPGLSIAGDVLTGTPTTNGSYIFGLTVTDHNGNKHVVLSVSLAVSDMSIAPPTGILPPAAVDAPYSQSFSSAGATPPYTFRTALLSDMPVGLSLSPSGLLSGIPTTWGAFSINIEAVDLVGQVFLQRYTLNVAPAGTVLPALTAAPDSISLTYVIGNPSPLPIPVNVSSTSTNFAFTAQANGGTWLHVAPPGSSTPGAVNLTFDVSGLTVGTYNGAVSFSSISAVNSPLSIPVILTVVNVVPCSFGISPGSSSVAATGGDVNFAVTTNCSWTTSTADSWISIDSPGSGTGNGSVTITAQPNLLPGTRTGIVTVQGPTFNLTYTLTQFGTNCAFAINPTSISVPSTQVTGYAISVNAASSGCPWTITPVDSWISGSGGGTGSGTAIIDISANAGGARTGSITIAGKTLIVNQGKAGCTYSLSDSGVPVSYSGTTGGPLSVGIRASTGCAWVTDPGPSWITVASGASGTGDNTFQTVQLSVAPNSSTTSRSADVVIGGQSYEITQSGVPCSFSVGVDNPSVARTGGTGQVAIGTDSECGWIASSNAPWLTLSSDTGFGSRTITFSATSNPDSAGRSATITVAGQTLNINQAGPTCEFTLRSASASIPYTGGPSTVGVVAAPGCDWTAGSLDTFISVTGGAISSGTNDVSFSVLPNSTSADRSGSLTIAGQSFTVFQKAAPCSITLGSPSFTAGEFQESSSFAYTTFANNCPHTVQSYANWISVTAINYAGTAGTVDFSVAPNGSATARVGLIKVGDVDFMVSQAPTTCAYTLTRYSQTFGRLGGTDAIPVEFEHANCGPPPVSVVGPLGMISGISISSSPGLFDVNYTTGLYQSFIHYIRQSQLTIGGQLFTVKQKSWVDVNE